MKQYYVVNAGRFGGTSRATHIMYSQSASTPDPMSPGSIIAQLAWFGGNAKRTLCGLPATRYVDAFKPREVSCRECRRRWETAHAQMVAEVDTATDAAAKALEDGTPRDQLSPLARKQYDDLAAWEQASQALADGTPRSQLSRAARKEYDQQAPYHEAVQAYHRGIPREQVSPAAREPYDKLVAEGGPRLMLAEDQAAQAEAQAAQGRATVDAGLDDLEQLFAVTDLAHVSDTDLRDTSAELEDLAAQIDGSDAASGGAGQEWQAEATGRIARLRAQLEAALTAHAAQTEQWVRANMPDEVTDTTRYGTATMEVGEAGSNAARAWVQANVAQDAVIRDVTLAGFNDNGTPVYHVTYEYEVPDGEDKPAAD
jgi:hypothetical protein